MLLVYSVLLVTIAGEEDAREEDRAAGRTQLIVGEGGLTHME